MPTLTLSTQALLNDLETDLSVDELEDSLSQLGIEVEGIDDTATDIEVFPNRPDFLSRTGVTRNLKGVLGETTGLPAYDVKDSDYEVIINESVTDIRPYTACAVVTGLNLDQDRLDELITLQEKLHVTYGRDRKKCAIGLYPASKISFPVTYTAKQPSKISFTPLGSDTALNAAQLLEDHEKGKEHGWILDGYEQYPVFEDAQGSILSMPPIINSEATGAVSTNDEKLFIECSGHDFDHVNTALSIIVADLLDNGGEAHRVTLSYPDTERYTPDMTSSGSQDVSVSDVNDWLGTSFDAADVCEKVEAMRHRASISENNDIINVSNPPYRSDIIGDSDIYEDIAIGHGYNNITPDDRRLHTNGGYTSLTVLERRIRDSMVGAGFQEVYTYSLCDADKENELSLEQPVEVVNSASDRYTGLRSSVIPSHLGVLQDNTSTSYPQEIFEVGRVFTSSEAEETGVEESEVLTATVSGRNDSFSRLRNILERLKRLFDIDFIVEQTDHPVFIDGRGILISTNNDDIGVIGEVHPRVLDEYDIKQATSLMELSIDAFQGRIR